MDNQRRDIQPVCYPVIKKGTDFHPCPGEIHRRRKATAMNRFVP
jgi:hypothetical protein